VIAGWDPECVTRAKEILYRCLEELGSVKAALYLSGSAGSFELAAQYGFGKRDPLAAEVKAGQPLWDWIRRHRTTPGYLNEARDDPTLGRQLLSGGATRLLTVPLSVAGRLVGFIEGGEKARRAPYAAADVSAAREIGRALERLLREHGLFGATPEDASAAAAVAPPEALAPAPLHCRQVEDLVALLRSLARLPEVSGIALSLTEGSTVRMLVLRSLPLEQQEREAIAAHHQQRLE
jgi:hypothetical protein